MDSPLFGKRLLYGGFERPIESEIMFQILNLILVKTKKVEKELVFQIMLQNSLIY
ncbi:hypothetical protein TTHERM_000155256 (macronuclear) [Tetrahymena thermophila SB210]|uniref:Uncharacterized protein n=1 Tax=Tetrahymena thermophila (strain SB210) TaxID=312017 RepID=W7X9C0_TETTS|nr:hypothetical protein TTHERM_000155256 [Tetrahymena thermophila SB210]EWS75995.1 hypothetical protein TTHERM_000155256 [Tetrahymena thermophila SB210]|eukprot:XP_012651513.1 hypothetical protein TTHERM_000155256 [Tetrahymena thermophila SB210]